MSWPTTTDYKEAIQNADRVFLDPILRSGKVQRKKNGLPWSRDGANAVVFKLDLPKNEATAVRLFKSGNDEREQRYGLIHDHLDRAKLQSLVSYSYKNSEIRVLGKLWPVLAMHWVNGRELGSWLAKAVEDGKDGSIRAMADAFFEMMADLYRAQIAHGDLQHRNIMVVGSKPVLVDYDGMCVPSLVGREAQEHGLPAYQHPQRVGQPLSLELDHFAAWIIAISLRATAADLGVYRRFVEETGEETLLFTPDDITQPDRSATWKEVLKSPDAEVRAWSERIIEAIRGPFDQIPKFGLNPCEGLARVAAASPQDWGGIASAGSSAKAAGCNPPPNLAAVLAEANRRVQSRDRLEQALNTKDPRAVALVYTAGAKDLDTWPACAPLVQAAKKAKEQVGRLDELRVADAAAAAGSTGLAKFLDLWKRSVVLLDGIAEAEPYRNTADRLTKVREACDRLLAALKAKASERTIDRAWKEVQALGGHSDATPYRAEAEKAGLRADRLDELAGLPDLRTEEADRRLAAAWDATLLGTCREADRFRDRVRDAATRLTSLAALVAAIGGADGSPDAEAQIESAAKKLPGGYAPQLSSRVKEAADRSETYRALDSALLSGSDTRIAEAWEAVMATGLVIADTKIADQSRLSVQRRDRLRSLESIPKSLPADEQDRRWVNEWDDALLQSCGEAQAFRLRFDLARRRRALQAAFERALADRDVEMLKDLVNVPEIQDYPPFLARRAEADDLLRVTLQVEAIREAVGSGEPGRLEEALDLSLLRENETDFRPFFPEIRQFVTMALELPEQRLTASRRSFVVEVDGSIRLFWNWPKSLLVTACRISHSTRGYLTGSSARESSIKLSKPLYESGAGARMKPPPPGSRLFVTISAVVDLGWAEFSGPELRLPPINGVAQPPGSGKASGKLSLRDRFFNS